jgi:predicted RNase H-related nuclease YkuK (DUF458 family)
MPTLPPNKHARSVGRHAIEEVSSVKEDGTIEGYWHLPGSGKKYSETEVFEETLKSLLNKDYEWEVAIGTDSQIRGRYFRFISVICLYRKGKGGFYYYKTTSVPRRFFPVNNQKMRMFDEVGKSINLALEVEKFLGGLAKPVIHIDASIPKNGAFTSSFSEQLKGYVLASGYSCMLKPESYVANCIADRHSKKRSKRRYHTGTAPTTVVPVDFIAE